MMLKTPFGQIAVSCESSFELEMLICLTLRLAITVGENVKQKIKLSLRFA